MVACIRISFLSVATCAPHFVHSSAGRLCSLYVSADVNKSAGSTGVRVQSLLSDLSGVHLRVPLLGYVAILFSFLENHQNCFP